MKTFLKYFIFILISLSILLYVLDVIYTSVYEYGTPRDKVSWVKAMRNTTALDYIVLGSSRCIHHINSTQIEELSNKKGLNLGYAACGSFEIKLMLQEFLKNNTVNKVFIQVDENYNSVKPNELAQVSWMPFIKEPDIYNEFKKYGKIYSKYKFIPFYRYQKFEPKIGIRTISLSLLREKPNFIKQRGFIPVYGELKDSTLISLEINKQSNRNFKEIIELCIRKKIEVIFFTAPIYNHKNNFEVLKTYLPNYYNFSNTIIDKKYFKDQTHLNSEGAKEFTTLFTQTFFN